LIGHLAFFGQKLQPKKQNFDKNLKGVICLYWASLCSTIARQLIELESCSNPPKMREVLWIRFLKNWKVLDLSFFVGDVIRARPF